MTVVHVSTVTDAETQTPSINPTHYVTMGYDAGHAANSGATYAQVTVEPSHAGKFQNGNGVWYEVQGAALSATVFGAKCDGATDDSAAINAALNVCDHVTIPHTAQGCKIDAAITFARDGQKLEGVGAKDVKIIHGSAQIAAPIGTDWITIENVRFYGPHSSSSYHTTLENCHNWTLKNVTFEHQNSGLTLINCNHWVWDVAFHEVRGSCVQLYPGSHHHFMRCEQRNVGAFGLWLRKGANDNLIEGVKRYLDTTTITPYLNGLVSNGFPTSVSGRLGFEAVGVRVGANYNQIVAPIVENVAENGISLSGNRNALMGGKVLNCEILGVGIYGNYNKVVCTTIYDCGKGASSGGGLQVGANAGGIARYNQIIGVEAFFCRTGFIAKEDVYVTWASGGGTSTFYCKSIAGDGTTRIYRSRSGRVTQFGTNKPDHDGGAIEGDGINLWEHMQSVGPGQELDAQFNSFVNCYADGSENADFSDTTTTRNNTYIACNSDQKFFSNASGSFSVANPRSLTSVSGNTIDVTGHRFVELNVSGGATIDTITTSEMGEQVVTIQNKTGTSIVVDSFGSIRIIGRQNRTLSGIASITLKRVTGNVWEEVV